MSHLDRMFRIRAKKTENDRNPPFKDPLTGKYNFSSRAKPETLNTLFTDTTKTDHFIEDVLGSAFAKDPEWNTDNKKEKFVQKIMRRQKLDDSEKEFLVERLREYNSRHARFERLKELLTPEEIGFVTAQNKTLDEIAKSVGPEKAAEFLHKDLERRILQGDDSVFDNITRSLKHMHTVRTGAWARASSEHLERTLKRIGISSEDVEDIFSLQTEDLQKEALYSALRKDPHNPLNLLDRIGARWKSWQVLCAFNSQKYLYQVCELDLQLVGNILQSTLKPETQDKIIKFALGEAAPKPAKRGAAAFREAEKDFTTTAVRKRFKQYRDEAYTKLRANRGKGYKPTGTEKAGILEGFIKKEAERKKPFVTGTSLMEQAVMWLLDEVLCTSPKTIKETILNAGNFTLTD